MRHRCSGKVHRLVFRLVGAGDGVMRTEGLQAAVRVHHPLGHAGGATRGREHDHIVHVDGNGRPRCRLIPDPFPEGYRAGKLGRLAIDADPVPDLGQRGLQFGDHRREILLEEQHFAIEGIEHVVVLFRRIARTNRNPAHVRPPQAERAGPGGDVIHRPHCALGTRRQTGGKQGVGDAAGQLAHFLETVFAVVLDVGRAGRVTAPAPVKEVDSRHAAPAYRFCTLARARPRCSRKPSR
jgi:hypothetical protein